MTKKNVLDFTANDTLNSSRLQACPTENHRRKPQWKATFADPPKNTTRQKKPSSEKQQSPIATVLIANLVVAILHDLLHGYCALQEASCEGCSKQRY